MINRPFGPLSLHFFRVCAFQRRAAQVQRYYGRYSGLGSEHDPSSSPVDHVRADAPAFFVAHGEYDTYVPVSGAREFAEKLRAVSQSTVVYAELLGAQHSFDLLRSPRFESVVDAVEAFLLENGPWREGA
jgi:acetyl esterase/lipase